MQVLNCCHFWTKVVSIHSGWLIQGYDGVENDVLLYEIYWLALQMEENSFLENRSDLLSAWCRFGATWSKKWILH